MFSRCTISILYIIENNVSSLNSLRLYTVVIWHIIKSSIPSILILMKENVNNKLVMNKIVENWSLIEPNDTIQSIYLTPPSKIRILSLFVRSSGYVRYRCFNVKRGFSIHNCLCFSFSGELVTEVPTFNLTIPHLYKIHAKPWASETNSK